MSRISVWFGVLVVAALLVPVGAAQSASALLCTSYSSCSRAGYSHGGYESKQRTSYWNMYTGTNCTNYVAYRLISTNGLPNTRPRPGVGNARDWGPTMSDVTDKSPTVGSVAWWGRPSGGNHVAYVERVISSGEILISESNYGRAFDWRRITKGSGWPDGFIHFADAKLKNTSKPTIASTPKVGTRVTATPGGWSLTPKLSYQWMIDGTTAIRGATSRTFTPKESMYERKLSVRVTAKKSGQKTLTSTSKAVGVRAGSLASTAPPAVAGTPAVEQTLTAQTSGAWSPTPTSFRYQWYANGQKIAGATDRTYTPDADDVGDRLKVNIRAFRDAHHSSLVSSKERPPVALGTLAETTKPTVTTGPTVDKQLTVTPGGWKQQVQVTYQWQRDGRPINGATTPSYQPTVGDLGTKITATVTSSRPGYRTIQRTVTAGTVAKAVFAKPGTPTVSGSPQVGRPLQALPGLWQPEPAILRYAWFADGKAIKGATDQTYVPTAAQKGKKLTVKVLGERPGYVSRTVVSTATKAVASGAIVFDQEPTITGTPELGHKLSAQPGVTPPPGGTISYRWYRGKTALSARSRTYTPVKADLGQPLTVTVTASAPGYTTVSRSAAPVVVKATPKVTVKATGGKGSATFVITVTAAGSPATGNVSVTLTTKKDWTRLRSGKATLRITDIKAGADRAFTIRYGGSASVLPTEKIVHVTVR